MMSVSDAAAASAVVGSVTGFVVAFAAFVVLEAFAWWRWKRPRRPCGLEMMAGTGICCQRPHNHRGSHLIAPADVFRAGYVLPPF